MAGNVAMRSEFQSTVMMVLSSLNREDEIQVRFHRQHRRHAWRVPGIDDGRAEG